MFGLGAKSNVPNTSQYDFKGTSVIIIINFQMKPPPSSYKPSASRAGNVGTSGGGGDARPKSNRGLGFSNKLSEKANQL